MTIYRKLLIRLKRKYHQYSIRVCRRHLKDNLYGSTTHIAKNQFTIVINSKLDENDACHTLTHEFAHVAAWDEFIIHNQEHGPIWGIEHSRCYQVFEELITELNTQ